MRFLPRPLVILLYILLICSACSAGDAQPRFDSSRAFGFLEAQVAFGPRVPGTGAHSSCADWLLKTLAGSADTSWADRWSHVTAGGDTLGLANIHAGFNPGSRERVLLCAHWDSRPVAEHDPDPTRRSKPIPGANDGASGVAVLLELARIFTASRPTPGVDIVLFDGEDYGDFYADTDVLLGSRRFAARFQGYHNRLGILLDMVGDRQARFAYEGYSWQWRREDVSLVWDTAARLGYGQVFVRQSGPAVIDDHLPLLQAGIRCIDIVQMGLPYWHTQADTPDKCSPASLEAVGRTLATVIYSLE